MARAIIGGLVSSNLITLVVVPTVYSLFERRKLKEGVEKDRAASADRHPDKALQKEPV
jgi:hypothetical protein